MLKNVKGFYLKAVAARNYTPVRLEKLLRHIETDKSMRVADFGCGYGMLMEFIAPKVKSYIGVDCLEGSIKGAREWKEKLSVENAEFVCADINEFCENHIEAFDVGFAMDISEHVYDKEWQTILESIRKSIKPNGKLYLHTPNAEFFIEIMKDKDFILKQFPSHIAVRSPEQNASILTAAGFHIEQVRLVPHYNVLRFLHPVSYIPVLGKYFKARILIQATP